MKQSTAKFLLKAYSAFVAAVLAVSLTLVVYRVGGLGSMLVLWEAVVTAVLAIGGIRLYAYLYRMSTQDEDTQVEDMETITLSNVEVVNLDEKRYLVIDLSEDEGAAFRIDEVDGNLILSEIENEIERMRLEEELND